LYSALSYTIHTLYQTYLALQNQPLKNSNQEIEKIKSYILKVKETLSTLKGKEQKKKSIVNIAAANRFIAHNLDKKNRKAMKEKFPQHYKTK